LARLAGFFPAGVICEILNEDGTMADLGELFAFAQRFSLKIGALSDLIRYRLRTEHHIKRVEEATLPTPWGTFRALTYESCLDGRQHVLLSVGTFSSESPALVRVHTQCVAGDVFGSALCSCHVHLQQALKRISHEGNGAVLYLQPQARPIRLDPQRALFPRPLSDFDSAAATNAHALDLRDYGIGAQILRHVGIGSLRLMTTNPDKVEMLEQYGLDVVDQVLLDS
jgi:3,4-dihydroxy 2-butanone 4-phosphate synthase/GTP cyclohydrolase II